MSSPMLTSPTAAATAAAVLLVPQLAGLGFELLLPEGMEEGVEWLSPRRVVTDGVVSVEPGAPFRATWRLLLRRAAPRSRPALLACSHFHVQPFADGFLVRNACPAKPPASASVAATSNTI